MFSLDIQKLIHVDPYENTCSVGIFVDRMTQCVYGTVLTPKLLSGPTA